MFVFTFMNIYKINKMEITEINELTLQTYEA